MSTPLRRAIGRQEVCLATLKLCGCLPQEDAAVVALPVRRAAAGQPG
jgi:hypothetical protein